MRGWRQEEREAGEQGKGKHSLDIPLNYASEASPRGGFPNELWLGGIPLFASLSFASRLARATHLYISEWVVKH